MKKKTAKKKAALTEPVDPDLSFAALVSSIREVHENCAAAVSRTVNTTLTLRNWVIGGYIHHYELHGKDKAHYGDGLLTALADHLKVLQISNSNRRQLYRYLRFFRLYPQIVGTLSPLFETLPSSDIFHLPIFDTEKVGTVSPPLGAPTEQLIQCLSYSHLELIADLDDPLKRAFYEIECIRGNWSVRALKRQIGALYFERSGLSKDKEKLSALANRGVETAEPKLAIRDPYIFEFLGLRAKDAMAKSDLEAALIEHLREFLLELGHGFCLEAQQKGIVIGRTRVFIDLVFYHRILKCHVLVELKVEEFKHEHIGQLNTYVSWYREHIMTGDDNPPVGLLLCTEKDHSLVRYATESMDNRLFVSKYAIELPAKEDLERFLQQHRDDLEAQIVRSPSLKKKKK